MTTARPIPLPPTVRPRLPRKKRNFMADDDQAKVRVNYGSNYDRLTQVKRAYDPENLFHLKQNIPPSR